MMWKQYFGLALIAGSMAMLAIPACGPSGRTGTGTPPPPGNCSLTLQAQERDDPVWRQLGCGPVMRWFSGANAGTLGGPAGAKPLPPPPPLPQLGPRRTLLHEHHLHGYTAGQAAPCINVPTGQ